MRKSNMARYKLCADEVIEILNSSEKNIELAKKYGVTPTTISEIRKGKTWSSLRKIFETPILRNTK
jgi:transcriptional regulator with XRE-family HTH domain